MKQELDKLTIKKEVYDKIGEAGSPRDERNTISALETDTSGVFSEVSVAKLKERLSELEAKERQTEMEHGSSTSEIKAKLMQMEQEYEDVKNENTRLKNAM